MNNNKIDKLMREKVRQAENDGKDDNGQLWFIAEKVTPNDAALCRNTKPLIEEAYSFFRAGLACRVEGRDIGEGLIALATRWKKVKTLGSLLENLDLYQETQTKKFKEQDKEYKVATLEDKCDTLRVIINSLLGRNETSIEGLIKHIRSLFGDTQEGETPKAFTLSTIHKAKGREWDRVYILRPDLMPSKYAKKAWQLEQEANLRYVAITRAKKELVYVKS